MARKEKWWKDEDVKRVFPRQVLMDGDDYIEAERRRLFSDRVWNNVGSRKGNYMDAHVRRSAHLLEVAVEKAYPRLRHDDNEARWDQWYNAATFDCKNTTTNSIPRGHHDATVIIQENNNQAKYLIFGRTANDYSMAWIINVVERAWFFDNAVEYLAGHETVNFQCVSDRLMLPYGLMPEAESEMIRILE